MFSGMPIAFALGAVATVFMIAFMPSSSVDTITQNVYEEMASITLLSIPLFILKGAAIGRSPAGKDLYGALACLVAPHPGRARHRQRFRLCLVCRDGRVVARNLLGDRLGRHPGNAHARLFRQLRCRHHRGRRHARHPAAALDHHDPLCGRRRAVAGSAVPGRHRASRAAGQLVRRLCDVAISPGIPPRPPAPGRDRGEFGAAAPGHPDHVGQVRAAAAGAAVRDPAHRRDDRALRRLCDALGDGGARRALGAGADRRHLQRVDAARSQADPGRDLA